MKILYIHHEYYDRRALYADAMRSLGYDVDTLNLLDKQKPGQVTRDDTRGYDVIWLLSAHYLPNGVVTAEAISEIANERSKLVAYTTLATHVPLEAWVDHYRRFDWLFFQHAGGAQRLRQMGVNAIYVPLGFHPHQYPRTVRPSRYPITFMGSPQTMVEPSADKRARILDRLRRFGIVVFGEEFRGRLHSDIPVYAYHTHEEQVAVYSQSKINLDIPYINSPLPEYCDSFHVKNRLFEIPSTGNFLLTADCPDFRQLLGDVACGFYEPEHVEEAVAKYLADDELRADTARTGFELIGRHTYRRRFESMFRMMAST